MRDHGLRLDGVKWGPFWATLVHVVRNAVDHGIEPADVRVEAGKSAGGALSLETHSEGGAIVFTVRDDGQGIAWDRIREKARKLGHRADTREDLIEAIFADGVSARDNVTDISGRGVGMAATIAECRRLGGHIEIDSENRRGTTFKFVFPRAERYSLPPAARVAIG